MFDFFSLSMRLHTNFRENQTVSCRVIIIKSANNQIKSFIWVRWHGPYTGTHTHAHNTQ